MRAGADTPIVAGVLAFGPNGSGMLRGALGAAATSIDPVANPDDTTGDAGGGVGVTAEIKPAPADGPVESSALAATTAA
jgi:hypothetical protein